MKNVLRIAFLSTAVVLASCSKDVEKRIDGDWDYDSVTEVKMTSPLDSTYSESSSGTITFNEDGTGKITEGDESDNFNWQMVGDDKVKMSFPNEEDDETVTWNVVENKRKSQVWDASKDLTFEENNETYTYTLDMKIEMDKK